jgi:hypothetical protein
VVAGGSSLLRPPPSISASKLNLEARQLQAPMQNTQTNNFGNQATMCPTSSDRGHDSERRGGAGASSPATSFLKGWQRERIQRLARICRCIDRGRQQGKRLRKIVILHAWRWRGRHYKSDPKRPIRFKASTILRTYYAWRNGGRTPATLALGYWRGNRRASGCQVVELSKLCLAADTKSFSAAYRSLKSPGATESAYRRAMPARVRIALANLHDHRRHGESLERAARKLLGEVVKC